MDRYANIDPRLREEDRRQRAELSSCNINTPDVSSTVESSYNLVDAIAPGDVTAPTAHNTDTDPADSTHPDAIQDEQPHYSGSLFVDQGAVENAAIRARRQRSAMIRELAPNQLPRLDPGPASAFMVDHGQEVARNWTPGAASIYMPGFSLHPAGGSRTGAELDMEVAHDGSAAIKKPNKVNKSNRPNKPNMPNKPDMPSKVNKPKKFGSLYNESGKLPLPLAQYRKYMNGDLEMNSKFAEPQVAAVPCERCAEKKLVCKILHRTGDHGHVFSRMRKPWAKFEVSNYTVCGNCWQKAGQAQKCSFWKRPEGKEKPPKPHSVNPRPDRNTEADEEKDLP